MIYYTAAPTDYDAFGTQTIGHTGLKDSRGREIRKVDIAPEHRIWQTIRYESGLFPAWTEEQFNEQRPFLRQARKAVAHA